MEKPKVHTSTAVRQQARQLRREMTPAEKLLWERLRDRRLHGLKFRRQHPYGPFVADFYCAEHRLVVELDGSIHATTADYDQARTRQLEAFGCRVLRFSNALVETALEEVLQAIWEACQPSSPRPPSPNAGGRGSERQS